MTLNIITSNVQDPVCKIETIIKGEKTCSFGKSVKKKTKVFSTQVQELGLSRTDHVLPWSWSICLVHTLLWEDQKEAIHYVHYIN